MSWKKNIIGHHTTVSMQDLHPKVHELLDHPRIILKCSTHIVVEFYSTGDYEENAESVILEIQELTDKMDKACKVKDRILESMSDELRMKRQNAEMETAPRNIRPKKRRPTPSIYDVYNVDAQDPFGMKRYIESKNKLESKNFIEATPPTIDGYLKTYPKIGSEKIPKKKKKKG